MDTTRTNVDDIGQSGWIPKLKSQKHFRKKVTQDFRLTYSKTGGNLGLVSK